MSSILQQAIRTGIRTMPEVAAKEVTEILDFYITSLEKLNGVYLAAKRLCLRDDPFARELLRRAVAEAEDGL